MATSSNPPDLEPGDKVDIKDFADHLRTVQFTLLAVCLGLMVVTTSPARTDIAKAHQQILDILELENGWDQHWVQNLAKETMRLAISRDPSQAGNFYAPKAISIEGKRLNLNFDVTWTIRSSNNRLNPSSYRGDEAELQPESKRPSTASWLEAQLEYPTALREFHALWDWIENLVIIKLIDVYAESAELGGREDRRVSIAEIKPSNSYPTV